MTIMASSSWDNCHLRLKAANYLSLLHIFLQMHIIYVDSSFFYQISVELLGPDRSAACYMGNKTRLSNPLSKKGIPQSFFSTILKQMFVCGVMPMLCWSLYLNCVLHILVIVINLLSPIMISSLHGLPNISMQSYIYSIVVRLWQK